MTLLTGGLIYILFRTDDLAMFRWFDALALDLPIGFIREITMTAKNKLPNWFLYSLPDGLWIFSYISLILLLWKNEIHTYNFFWVYIIFFIAIISEIGQYFNLIPGTFDVVDLIFYALGAIIPLIIYNNNIFTKKEKQYEQNI